MLIKISKLKWIKLGEKYSEFFLRMYILIACVEDYFPKFLNKSLKWMIFVRFGIKFFSNMAYIMVSDWEHLSQIALLQPKS